MKSEIARETLVPPRLLPEIQAAAEEDHCAPDELVGEALEIYLKNRRWRRLVERGQARARELGLTEARLGRYGGIQIMRVADFMALINP